jgi:methylmalonyl-CoA mutase C-terminal domain/subunit
MPAKPPPTKAVPLRILIAKPGLDGHDRGALVVARALRDAGMEVVYTGLRQTPEQIVEAALQEDVHAIGISILSGAHNYLLDRVMELLREKGMEDVLVFVGGIIPDQDIARLRKLGVAEVFQPGSRLEDIVRFLRERLGPH